MHVRGTRAIAAVGIGIVVACGSGGSPPPLPPAPPIAAAPQGDPEHTPAPPAPTRDYPVSRRADVVETHHGLQVHDPYRWLEDSTQPEVQDWMKAQDSYARAHLAKLPGRDALAARLAEVFYFDALGAPVHRGDRYFFTRKHKDQEKAVLYWKQSERGADKVLLDPNQWSTDGSSSLKGWSASSDGRYLAYNKSEHNADETTLSILEVASGKPLKETIPGTKYGGASWTPDNRGFYYTYVPPVGGEISVAERPGFAELRFHALGSDPASDPVVREATTMRRRS
jgi:prolyl oligopeptidase